MLLPHAPRVHGGYYSNKEKARQAGLFNNGKIGNYYSRLRIRVSRIQAIAIHLVLEARIWSKPPFLF